MNDDHYTEEVMAIEFNVNASLSVQAFIPRHYVEDFTNHVDLIAGCVMFYIDKTIELKTGKISPIFDQHWVLLDESEQIDYVTLATGIRDTVDAISSVLQIVLSLHGCNNPNCTADHSTLPDGARLVEVNPDYFNIETDEAKHFSGALQRRVD